MNVQQNPCSISKYKTCFNIKQAGMSCAQPQAEAVSLEQTASFLLKIYTRPVVAEIFPQRLGFKFG
jgi:hypothetical protein